MKELQVKNPSLASCIGKWGYITFATLISKHRYLKEYLGYLDSKSVGLPEKFKLAGQPIVYGKPQDTRDLNLRYLDNNSPGGRACLMFLILLLPILALAGLFIALSEAFTIDQPAYCISTSGVTCSDTSAGSVYYYIVFPVIVILIVGANIGIRWVLSRFSTFLRDFSRVDFPN